METLKKVSRLIRRATANEEDDEPSPPDNDRREKPSRLGHSHQNSNVLEAASICAALTQTTAFLEQNDILGNWHALSNVIRSELL